MGTRTVIDAAESIAGWLYTDSKIPASDSFEGLKRCLEADGGDPPTEEECEILTLMSEDDMVMAPVIKALEARFPTTTKYLNSLFE